MCPSIRWGTNGPGATWRMGLNDPYLAAMRAVATVYFVTMIIVIIIESVRCVAAIVMYIGLFISLIQYIWQRRNRYYLAVVFHSWSTQQNNTAFDVTSTALRQSTSSMGFCLFLFSFSFTHDICYVVMLWKNKLSLSLSPYRQPTPCVAVLLCYTP